MFFYIIKICERKNSHKLTIIIVINIFINEFSSHEFLSQMDWFFGPEVIHNYIQMHFKTPILIENK